MSTTSQRRASQEQFWRAMLRRWHSSGLSVRAFCDEHGIAVPTFYAWRRTLAERKAAARFVPVQVIPEPKPQTTAAGLPSSLEVVLGVGRRSGVCSHCSRRAGHDGEPTDLGTHLAGHGSDRSA
jgi:transposase-like protein